MAEKKSMVVYAAAYETIEAALADLDAVEQMHNQTGAPVTRSLLAYDH